MKTKFLRWPLMALFVATATVLARADDVVVTLKPGDDAPPLLATKWVQGEPVKALEKGKGYVVEFWATWCGPCKETIPHLDALHRKFAKKGLVVIGQNVWEEDESKVGPFVKEMGDKMTYRVALDDKSKEEDGAMSKKWMAAAGETGIPTAFVVDKKGKIAWIGDPSDLDEKILDPVLDGTFDIEKAAAARVEAKKVEAELDKLWTQLDKAMETEKWDEADAVLKEIGKILPEKRRGALPRREYKILLGKKDYKSAYKIMAELSDKNLDDAQLQTNLAWEIATREGLENRDLKLAEKMATRAIDISKGKDPTMLDTLARVEFLLGKKDKAIATQKKAVDATEDALTKKRYQESLDSYKAGKLPVDK